MQAAIQRLRMRRTVPIIGGSLLGFVLIARFFVSLATGEPIGPTPGFALIGVACLVKVVVAVKNPDVEDRRVWLLRLALFWPGLAYVLFYGL